jgi:hypothetical protein
MQSAIAMDSSLGTELRIRANSSAENDAPYSKESRVKDGDRARNAESSMASEDPELNRLRERDR